MPRAFIFANGRMGKLTEIVSIVQESDLIIAADGGIHNCKTIGIIPNVIIGDLDSMSSDEVTIYQEAGVDVIQFPTHKDETDLELALQFALKHELSEVIIIGALGARWDMTIANILLIANPLYTSLKMRLLDGTQELVLLRAGERMGLHRCSGDTISLIPLAGDAQGIITQGLEYSLNNETLKFGSTRGVSNVFIQETAQVFLREGLLLCVINGDVDKSGLLEKET